LNAFKVTTPNATAVRSISPAIAKRKVDAIGQTPLL
jgi:hypothetical protein